MNRAGSVPDYSRCQAENGTAENGTVSLAHDMSDRITYEVSDLRGKGQG